MSKTLLPGIQGLYGTDQQPAIILGDDGSGGARLRILTQTPDDDAYIGDEAGFNIAAAPAALSDTAGTAGAFTATSPAVRYVDTEADLPTVPLGEEYEDVQWIVRNSEAGGQRYFVGVLAGSLVRVIPLAPSIVTTTLAYENGGVVVTVPQATDVVLGSTGNLQAISQTRRFPGNNYVSPAGVLWRYNDGGTTGILKGVPLGGNRCLLSVFLASITANKWTFVLQERLPPSLTWTDKTKLISFDNTPLGVTVSEATQTGAADFEVPAADAEYRVIIRHNAGAQRMITFERYLLAINSTGITPS